MSKVHNIKLYEKYLTDQPELVDYVVATIVKCILTNTKFCIQAPTGAGKTYFIKKLASRISKETGLNVRLIYPTNTLTNNQTDNKLNVRDLDAHYYENEFGEMVYDVGSYDNHVDILIVDEMHNIPAAFSYRPDTLTSIWNSRYVGGLSGTPEGLESLGVEIIKIERANPVKRDITFLNNSGRYSLDTLTRYVSAAKKKGSLLVIRHNNVNSLARIKDSIISKYKYDVATVFSTSKKGRDAVLESMNEDIILTHKEDGFDSIQKLNIPDSVDVLLGTQVLDEGLDLKVSDNRLVQAYMLEPYLPHFDEESSKTIWYQSNVTPTSVVQFDARNRTGLQETTIIAGFGDLVKPDFQDLTTMDNERDMLKRANELFKDTARYKEEYWKADVNQYSKNVIVKDMPLINKVWSNNQREGQIRKYICNTSGFHEWKSTLIRTGNEAYLECEFSELNQMSVTIKTVLIQMVQKEVFLAIRQAPLNAFVGSGNYLQATRDAMYEAYNIIEDEREKGADKKLLEQVLEYKSTVLDLTDWEDISEARQSIIKKLVSKFYEATTRFNSKTKQIKIKPEFEKKKFTDKTSDDLFWEARKHLK
jgi:hypothetical protein